MRTYGCFYETDRISQKPFSRIFTMAKSIAIRQTKAVRIISQAARIDKRNPTNFATLAAIEKAVELIKAKGEKPCDIPDGFGCDDFDRENYDQSVSKAG